ncbi:ABC transporter permease [Pelagicoccus sp. NFK12]|uniref:Transport permease protein n=1 Tax=Pelagicoccus enzymogenes TaxID=2773457 RepID=A0A927F9Q2_9BACT|nr:ABC transporter permease [Pelagicoccus enzymogenes]MBD5780909.1 ABC transporter permease [Pelagicoccus enzymogenes]MDQ8199947.1 ABC transporter permease [Pelagicoccus enzymogenes]
MDFIRLTLNALGLRAALENQQLLKQLTRRRISQQHKNTWLGKVWVVINPLAMLALYVFVFGYIFGGKFRETESDSPATYAFGVFLGLTIIHFVTEVLAFAPRSMADNEGLVKRTKIPLELIPTSITIAAAFHFSIGFLLCVLGLLAIGHPVGVQALWAIPVCLCLAVIAQGVSYLMAVLGTFVKDVSQIVPVLSLGILFSSAVFYPVEKIPAQAWAFLKFNPILHVVDTMRETVLWGHPPRLGFSLLALPIASLAIYFGSYFLFKSVQSKLADHI